MWRLDNHFADKTSLLSKTTYPNKPSPLKIANPLAIFVQHSVLMIANRWEYTISVTIMNTMFEKIQKIIKHPQAQQFKDVRVIGLSVFAVIVLLVTWSGLGAIQSNYVLQKQIARIEQENKVRELENNNLKLKNQYFNTDHYLELQARRQFGKAAPGETLILVPKDVAMKRTTDIATTQNATTAAPEPQKPSYQSNFEAWMDFFFHKNGS